METPASQCNPWLSYNPQRTQRFDLYRLLDLIMAISLVDGFLCRLTSLRFLRESYMEKGPLSQCLISHPLYSPVNLTMSWLSKLTQPLIIITPPPPTHLSCSLSSIFRRFSADQSQVDFAQLVCSPVWQRSLLVTADACVATLPASP